MKDIRFITAPLVIEFEEVDKKEKLFTREYDSLSEYEEDSIGQWLKLAKAKGETKDSDQVLLTLTIELHRKMDTIINLIKNEEKEFLTLNEIEKIKSIGYEHFKLEKKILKPECDYYGRIAMPVFPKREIPLFFKALCDDVGEIRLMHQKDMNDWNAYMAARERVMIRKLKKKGKNNV